MSRYKARHFLALFVLLSLPALTCGVGPVVQDLIDRVEALEAETAGLDAKVAALEAESVSLADRVGLLEDQSQTIADNASRLDSLEAESDSELVVIDANETRVGGVVPTIGSSRATVMFDLPGVPCS